MFYHNSGFVFELAQKFGAYVIFIEHRYYGKSVWSDTPDLSYLTAEQALADYAEVLAWLRLQLGVPNAPIIAMGGSYGAMLAAWFRIKYPGECAAVSILGSHGDDGHNGANSSPLDQGSCSAPTRHPALSRSSRG